MSAAHPWRQTIAKLWMMTQVCGLLLVLRLALPCIKLPRLFTWLTPSGPRRGGTPQALAYTVRCTDTLLRFVFPWRGKCLPRTLTLYYFATRNGCPVQAHCGIQRQGDKLQGHAWLSLHGRPFFESGDPVQHYAIILSFPRAAPGEDAPGLPKPASS